MAWLKEEEGGPGESEPKAALKDKVGDQEESTNQQVRREPGLRRHGKQGLADPAARVVPLFLDGITGQNRAEMSRCRFFEEAFKFIKLMNGFVALS